MKTLIALFGLIFTAAAIADPPPAEAEANAAIDRLREGLVGSFQKGDLETLLTYLDPNVVVTWQNGEVCHGPAEVRAFYQRMMTGEQRVVRELRSSPEILGRQLSGDTAVSWGRLHDHFILSDGSDLPFDSVFTSTAAKRGDRWLVTGFHASVNVFDNPVLTYAAHKVAWWVGLSAGLGGLVVGWAMARLLGRRKPARG